jgi:ribosomal protein S21
MAEDSNRLRNRKKEEMVAAKLEKNDSTDKLVRRFLRKVKKARIVEQVLDRRYYVKPSVKRRKAAKKREQTLRQLRVEREQDNS